MPVEAPCCAQQEMHIGEGSYAGLNGYLMQGVVSYFYSSSVVETLLGLNRCALFGVRAK